MPVPVQVDTGGVGDHGEDAGRGGVGLDVGGVVELLALRDHQLADPARGIGEPLDRRRRRNFGAQPVVAGLDRRNRVIAFRGLDERFDGSDDVVVVQRLADRRGRVAGVDLDHQVLFAVAGEVVLRAEAVPHSGADEHRAKMTTMNKPSAKSERDAPSTTTPLGADPVGARTRRRGGPTATGSSALPAVRHR